MHKLTGYQIPHQVLEHYRFRAVELRKEGKKVNDIAHYFGLNRVTVSYWLSKYKNEGKEALKSKKASGPKLKLSPKETMKILNNLKLPATDFGFETPLWTCKRV
jgi:transposase